MSSALHRLRGRWRDWMTGGDGTEGWGLEVGILLLAALIRLWDLDGPSLWMDEAFSHRFGTWPLWASWRGMIVDGVHPPFYYLLLRPWLALAGTQEFALRFPSVMAGVLTVALLLRVGRDWLGGKGAVLAALLLALNPFHVWYSQEGRMYVLLGLLSLGVLLTFWRVLHSQRFSDWVILFGLSALAYVTHYFALYLALIEFVFLLLTFRRHHQMLGRWTVAQGLAVLPLAGWLTMLYATAGGTFGIGWISTPTVTDLLKTAWSFGMAYDGRVTVLVVAGLAIWCGLLVVGLCSRPGRRDVHTLLALSLMLPPVVTFMLSLRRPVYVDRFLIGSLPAFVLLSSGGLVRLPRVARWGAIVALVGLCGLGTVRLHTDPVFAREGWREAVAYVKERATAKDVVALRRPEYVVPLGYYWGEAEVVLVTQGAHTRSLEEIAAGHARMWLVLRGHRDDIHHLAWSEPFDLARDESDPVARSWVSAHSPQVISFPGVSVMAFDLEDDS